MSGYPEEVTLLQTGLERKRRAEEKVELQAMTRATRKTFLVKAQEDYAACQRLIQESWFSPQSRTEMLQLLAEKIQAVRVIGADDQLYVTYETLERLMRGWWFEDDLKNVIRGTLRALRAGNLDRMASPHAVLEQKLVSLERVVTEQRQIIEQQKKEIDSLRAELRTAVAAVTLSNQNVERLLASPPMQRAAAFSFSESQEAFRLRGGSAHLERR